MFIFLSCVVAIALTTFKLTVFTVGKGTLVVHTVLDKACLNPVNMCMSTRIKKIYSIIFINP